MALDIRGSLKSTKLSRNPYVVFEELISNAIDAFLIRRSLDNRVKDLKIDINVEFYKSDLIGEVEDLSILCIDNGCGLGDEQLNAFLTKDTSYKDDLLIPGIGKCLGAGRIQYFHHFGNVSVDSVYAESGILKNRRLSYVEPKRTIDLNDFSTTEDVINPVGTSISLKNLKESVRERVLGKSSPSCFYSAFELKQKMLLAFLQRLVSLGNQLGNFEINFITSKSFSDDDSALEQKEKIIYSDLPSVTQKRCISVEERDPRTGDGLGKYVNFELSHYKLDAIKFNIQKNVVAFCAKSSPVKDTTPQYFRTRAEQKNPVNGSYHFILIEGDYFDSHVNEQRDDLEGIPEDLPNEDLFCNETISYSAIHEAIDSAVVEMVSPLKWDRNEVMVEICEQFGINDSMLQETSTRIRYGETAQAVAERVLKKYQEKVVEETSAIFELKEEIKRTQPDTEDFRQKINELAWKYTSSLKSFDMANLSQLIVRRAAIVEVLDLACGKSLHMQQLSAGERRKDERIIHSVFFPMRKDSDEVIDHDMWLLSEEYHYYDYIASDIPLANITWGDGEKVFQSDIDDEMKKLLEKRADENSAKRPDIAIFDKEGSVVIIEFKAPGVSLDEHIGDLNEYAHLLGARSGGRLKKFYGYLVGDKVNPLRLNGWTPFSQGKGWFQSSPLVDPMTRQPLGETYFEILHFTDLIDRAKKRINIYKNKINLNLK